VSFIVRCDAPGCTSKAAIWGALPAGWTQTHNRYGDMIHACATAGHVTAAQATTGRVATAAVV
jgi:hypothetical protein